jgi:hypothetical protein
LSLFRLFARKRLLRLLDQGKHIAHSQDTRSHPIRMKQFKRIQLLSNAKKLDRFARDGPDGQHGAAPRITFHLG